MFGEGIAFSCFSTREMPSFENIPNDALCAGVVLSAPFKAENTSIAMGNNINGKYVKAVLDKIRLFGAEPRFGESTLYISSLYEKRFVKNKIGENA